MDSSLDSLGGSNGSGPFLDLTTEWTYAAGKVTSVTQDPCGVDLMTRYDYDGDRLVATVVDPQLDVNGNDRGGTHLDLTTTYTSNANGKLTSETDADGVMRATTIARGDGWST